MSLFGGQSGVANGNIYPCTFVTWDTTAGFLNRFVNPADNGLIGGISQPGTDSFPFNQGAGTLDSNFAAVQGEEFYYWPQGSNWALLLLGGTVTAGQRLSSVTWNGIPGTGQANTSGSGEVGAIALVGGIAGDVIPVRVIGPAIGHT